MITTTQQVKKSPYGNLSTPSSIKGTGGGGGIKTTGRQKEEGDSSIIRPSILKRPERGGKEKLVEKHPVSKSLFKSWEEVEKKQIEANIELRGGKTLAFVTLHEKEEEIESLPIEEQKAAVENVLKNLEIDIDKIQKKIAKFSDEVHTLDNVIEYAKGHADGDKSINLSKRDYLKKKVIEHKYRDYIKKASADRYEANQPAASDHSTKHTRIRSHVVRLKHKAVIHYTSLRLLQKRLENKLS